MADQLSLVPRLAPGVLLQDIDDDVLAFDGTTLTWLTGAAALVVRWVNGVRSVHAIAQLAAASIGQPSASSVPLVVEAVDLMVAQGTIELTEATPEPGLSRPEYVGVCADTSQLVLLDLRTGDRHVLSVTGAEIWELVTATGSLSAAVAELESLFPGAHGIADDAARFVDDLVAQGLLERAVPPEDLTGP